MQLRGWNSFLSDPLKMELPVTQQSINFMYNPSVVPKNIQELNAKFAKLDALVIVCGEYNWSIPPPLTNMLDNVPPTTLAWKPVGYVTYSVCKFSCISFIVSAETDDYSTYLLSRFFSSKMIVLNIES